MPDGDSIQNYTETRLDDRSEARRVTDGGVAATRPPIEESRTYSDVLATLNELDRQLSSDSIDRGRLVQAIRQYVSMEYHGGGYVSGLTKAARLIQHGDVTTDEVSDVAVSVEPYDEILRWSLHANGTQSVDPLSEEAFAFCADRAELRRFLLGAVDRERSDVGLTDEQVVTLAERSTRPYPVVSLTETLRERGLPDQARAVMSRYFESLTGVSESVRLLRIASELEMTEVYRDRLRASLNRWQPGDGVDRLESLVDLGREAQLYDSVLLAVKRWLRANDRETVPEERRGLLAAAVAALLRGERTGRRDAIILYRQHLYPSTRLYGLGVDVYEAATSQGDDDVAADVLDAYDTESFVPGESDVETGKMAARAAEHDNRWDDAFDIWRQLLEDEPSRELFERAIENRLTVAEVEAAEAIVDRFDDWTDEPLRSAAYRARVANRRGNYRRVVDVVESTDGVFELDSSDVERVATAYVQALAEQGWWDDLADFLADTDSIDRNVHRFYQRVAELMQFAAGDGSMDGTTAIDVAERLLTAPMELEDLELLLNLGVTRQVADRIRSEYPAENDRLDVVEGLLEILVSLHAERLIDELGERGIDTEEFEQMFAETDLGRGGRQLLSTLEREARRAGITETL